MKTKNKKTPFFDKLKFRYKLCILNEKTLEEVFHIELSRLSAFVLSVCAVLVVFVLMSLFILYSPIKYYLPGFSDYSVRKELTNEVIKVDSLYKHISLQNMQIKVMKNIIEGSVSMDSIPKIASKLSYEKLAELSDKKSEREIKFEKDYNNSLTNNLNISDISDIKTKELFYVPMFGTVVKSADNKGVNIIGKNTQNVLAAADGIIIFASFTFNNGYVVVIQHNDGYLSAYYNLTDILKKEGDKVAHGEAFALIDNSKKVNNNAVALYFELWHNGKTVNPQDVINF